MKNYLIAVIFALIMGVTPTFVYAGVNYPNGYTCVDNGPLVGVWCGVNNLENDYNPFGSWTGVNNLDGYYTGGAGVGTWSGITNTDNSYNSYYYPGVGTWTGVDNRDSGNYNSSYYNAGVGTWTGVNNLNSSYASSTTDPYGVNAAGYGTPRSSASTATPSQAAVRSGSYFVAPTTGVNIWVPLLFAGIVTALFFAVRHRKRIFT